MAEAPSGFGSSSSGIVGPILSFVGGGIQAAENRAAEARQRDAQRDFAHHGIQWRVNDAVRAGLHPLYALGANVPTYSPVSTMGGGIGEGIREMGQDLSRSARATMTPQQQAMHELQLEEVASRIRLTDAQTNALYSSSARLGQQAGPGIPSQLPTDSPVGTNLRPDPAQLSVMKPVESRASALSNPAHSAAGDPFWGFHMLDEKHKFWGPWTTEGPAELFENLDYLIGWPMTLAKNLQMNPNFFEDIKDLHPALKGYYSAREWLSDFYEKLDKAQAAGRAAIRKPRAAPRGTGLK